jgi:hypothetical protein
MCNLLKKSHKMSEWRHCNHFCPLCRRLNLLNQVCVSADFMCVSADFTSCHHVTQDKTLISSLITEIQSTVDQLEEQTTSKTC